VIREICLDSGMNYYISKPVKIEEMRMDFERSCQWLKAEQTLSLMTSWP
jgi:CheY-like chemotaxis protein